MSRDEPVPLLNRCAARVLDDLAWPLFLPLTLSTWCGVVPPMWLVRTVVAAAGPLQRRSLWLRGWRGKQGVSGS